MTIGTQNDIMARLEKLAFKKTTPFCSGCYCKAPTGTCARCGSDDMQRSLDGEVDWGVDWVIQSLLSDALTPVDTEAAFEESFEQCFPTTTTVGWLDMDTATILKRLDPISWELAEGEWIDSQMSDEILSTFDNGSSYYWTCEVDAYLDGQEADDEAA
jgi:hypothetical protein